MPPTWLQLAQTFSTARGVAPRYVDVLRAFDGPTVPVPVDSFEALEALCIDRMAALAHRIEHELPPEIDEEQARIFSRRFIAIRDRLDRRRDDPARVLRVGLVQRVEQVLDADRPGRALRIRAVVDYLYSQVALLQATADGPGPGVPTLVGQARWIEVAPGIAHATVEGLTDHGPQHLNLLRVQPGAARLRMADLFGNGIASLADHSRQVGAAAAFSGGFFLYSEPDIAPPSRRHDPVGLLVRDGKVVSPAPFRRGALVQREDGSVSVEIIGPADLEVHLEEWRPVADLAPVTRATATRASGLAVVGTTVVAHGSDVAVPLNGMVLATDAPPPTDGTVRWRLRDQTIRDAIAGGPTLVRDGNPGFSLVDEDFAGTAPPQTFSGDETGDRNLLPRLGVGVCGDGALVVVAADGRNLQRALGLPLHTLAEVLVSLGAQTGLNLDGGSSKRMVVRGQTVDLPTTDLVADDGPAATARPVHTAVLLTPLS